MFGPVLNGLEGWPFNELERALEAGVSTPSQMPHVWPVLMRSTLFVLAVMPTQAEQAAAAGSRLMMFTADDGHQAVMAFTSEEVARASVTEAVALTPTEAAFLMDYLGEVSLLVNPRGPFGKEFLAHELKAGRRGVVSAGPGQLHLAADTQVFFGALAEEPHELVEAVVSVCRADETVKGAYLSGVCVPAAGDTAAHPLVGIDAEDFAAAKAKVSRAMGGWTTREKTAVDFVNMREASAFAEHLKKSGKRIYKRGGWLGGLMG